MFDSLATVSNSKRIKGLPKKSSTYWYFEGEECVVSNELGFWDVVVPEILRLRGDLSAGN